MHLYLQLTRSLTVTLIWFYCNKLVLRHVRLRVSDPGQVSIPQPGIVTLYLRLYLGSCLSVAFPHWYQEWGTICFDHRLIIY